MVFLLLLLLLFPGTSGAPGCCLKKPCPLTGTGCLTAAVAPLPGAEASSKTWKIRQAGPD